MRWEEIGNVPCSVARSLAIIGDRWTLLIIRDCFYGTSRFDAFHKHIGMTRHLLSDRLNKLVEAGILVQEAYQQNPVRYDYFLTEMGRDLYPVLITLAGWGDRWLSGDQGAPVEYVHSCGEATTPVVVCETCGEPLTHETVMPRRGPGFPEATKPAHYATYIHQLDTEITHE